MPPNRCLRLRGDIDGRGTNILGCESHTSTLSMLVATACVSEINLRDSACGFLLAHPAPHSVSYVAMQEGIWAMCPRRRSGSNGDWKPQGEVQCALNLYCSPMCGLFSVILDILIINSWKAWKLSFAHTSRSIYYAQESMYNSRATKATRILHELAKRMGCLLHEDLILMDRGACYDQWTG